jgi:YD repeat-containing protein
MSVKLYLLILLLLIVTGNLNTSTDAMGNTSSYKYDPATGYMLSMTDPSGHTNRPE